MASFFENLKNGGKQFADGVANKAAQYANKPFLKAVTAGSALIVAADGVIEDSEIDEFVDFATTNSVLKHYSATEKMTAFKDALNKAKDKMAQAELMGEIAAFNGKPEAVVIAEVLVLLASADGNVAEAEKKMLKRVIGRALGLDATQYID